MSPRYDLPVADRLVVGTVGPPGEREFFIQARQGVHLVTLKVEKAHVAELSTRLLALLSELPDVDPGHADDELESPVEADFVVGSLALAYDEADDRVVLVAEELVAEGADGDVASIGASRQQIAALAQHGAALVAAGRPTCQLCGFPLDPRGHVCPRSNGHGPPTP